MTLVLGEFIAAWEVVLYCGKHIFILMNEAEKSHLVHLFPNPLFFFLLQVFLPVPFMMVAMSFFLVLAPIVWSPNMQYVYAFLFMLGSLIIYLPFIHFKWRFAFLDKITCHLQLLLEVCPADGPAEGKCE